jgi:hypothetical protein
MTMLIESSTSPVVWRGMFLPPSAAALSRCGWLESWEADEREVLPQLPGEDDVRAAERAWEACSETMMRPAHTESLGRFVAWLNKFIACWPYAPTLTEEARKVYLQDLTVHLSGFPLAVLEEARSEAVGTLKTYGRVPDLSDFKAICEKRLSVRRLLGLKIERARRMRDESTKRLRQWLSQGVTHHPEVRSLMAQLSITDEAEARRLCGLAS